MQRNPGWRVAAPVEGWIGDDTARHQRRAIVSVGCVGWRPVGCNHMPENGRLVLDIAVNGAGVRIEEELRRIATQSVIGTPWSLYPKAVTLPRADSWNVTMPA